MYYVYQLTILQLLLCTGFAANIFVSHYSGTINTLTFNPTNDGNYSLALNTSLRIGGQPSWMTWDAANRTIYASDETSPGNGSLTAVSAATNGSLTQIARATAIGGGVANVLYGDGGYVAIAH